MINDLRELAKIIALKKMIMNKKIFIIFMQNNYSRSKGIKN